MDILKEKLNLLPDNPGVYLMKNAEGNIIYVGKAKVLKNRVRSYFTGSHDQKTQKLVGEISDFEYILTSSEVEALLLECNLIKKYNPHYNIMLKDDKSYPYILISSEKHPRIIVTRKINKNSGKFFGPFPNVAAARETARLLNRLLPFRKCSRMPARLCLYYHLGQCLGPCANNVPPAEYEQLLDKANAFLRGNQKKILSWLEERMKDSSAKMHYEAAREYRELINDLKKINEKQKIILNDFKNRDIVAYAADEELISIQVFCLRQGSLVTRDGFIFPYYEEIEESFLSFLLQYYAGHAAIPDEICIPEIKDIAALNILPLTVPKKGKIKELIALAVTNAQSVLTEKINLENRQQKEIQTSLALLAKVLQIPRAQIIEAFDISGISGTNVVGGMVRFQNGKPCRSGYRKYNIFPSENNNDDTAYLKHIILRRYSRLLRENSQLPDLILVDGGKGQVKAVLSGLQELKITIPVAGMVKDEHHETRSLINNYGQEISLTAERELYRLIYRIQEEAHRFAITFHRRQRLKNMTASELDNVPGIGAKRKRLLFKQFQSLAAIKNATVEELKISGLPENIARQLFDHFHNQPDSD